MRMKKAQFEPIRPYLMQSPITIRFTISCDEAFIKRVVEEDLFRNNNLERMTSLHWSSIFRYTVDDNYGIYRQFNKEVTLYVLKQDYVNLIVKGITNLLTSYQEICEAEYRPNIGYLESITYGNKIPDEALTRQDVKLLFRRINKRLEYAMQDLISPYPSGRIDVLRSLLNATFDTDSKIKAYFKRTARASEEIALKEYYRPTFGKDGRMISMAALDAAIKKGGK